MTKIILVSVILLVITGGIYFVVQDQDNKEPLQEDLLTPNQSIRIEDNELPETIDDSEQEQVTSPTPTYSTPGSSEDSGIDSLPLVEEPNQEEEGEEEIGPNPDPVTIIIIANDISASPDSITAISGAEVTLIFQVDTKNVAFGGLDFRSPVINTGTIKPGESKTVKFIALASFDFTPYWPSSETMKGYRINIIVE